jgi:hypothetical protein
MVLIVFFILNVALHLWLWIADGTKATTFESIVFFGICYTIANLLHIRDKVEK